MANFKNPAEALTHQQVNELPAHAENQAKNSATTNIKIRKSNLRKSQPDYFLGNYHFSLIRECIFSVAQVS